MTTPPIGLGNEGVDDLAEASTAPATIEPAVIDPALWELLACPCPAHGDVVLDGESGEIVCTVCGLRFPIRDGIPVMLLDEARKS
ncbi:MAG: Trm112 family protein [Candidatus Nanopelagicales bacterium]|jgi:hypothetical protein